MNPWWGYAIKACWGPRRENPAQIGGRYWRMLQSLAPIDPLFSGWEFGGLTRFWDMPQGPGDELSGLIADCVARADDGDPTPIFGYGFAAGTRSRSKTSLTIHVSAGSYVPVLPYFGNKADLITEPLNEENAALIKLSVFKPALLAMAAAWDATWCAAYPWDIVPLWPKPGPGRPHFLMAWITYLSPRFAPLVDPPRSAIVEYTPAGGIVMTATEDRFDVDNPRHLAIAREIEAAMAPVNALPWPPDAEPEPPASQG